MNSTELELLDGVRDGDRMAMRRLYELYLPRLGRFLYRVVQDAELIQELVNDVMLTVWQNAGAFRRESTVSTWILGIAYRKALDALRRQKRYSTLVRQVPEPDRHDDDIGYFIAERDLNRLLVKLSLEQRAVAELSFDFGYSYPEIAEILGVPVNTVKTRMYYARRTMQEAYSSRGNA